jgi:hypothetical protein
MSQRSGGSCEGDLSTQAHETHTLPWLVAEQNLDLLRKKHSKNFLQRLESHHHNI